MAARECVCVCVCFGGRDEGEEVSELVVVNFTVGEVDGAGGCGGLCVCVCGCVCLVEGGGGGEDLAEGLGDEAFFFVGALCVCVCICVCYQCEMRWL